MEDVKERLVGTIQRGACRRAGRLAGQLARARPEEKESVLAALEFERWLAETCDLCLNESHEGPS